MNPDTDCSFTRGIKKCEELYDRTREMTWVLGYANIISLLNDKNLQKECMEVSAPYIYGSWEDFHNGMKNQYLTTGKLNYFLEIFKVLPDEQKKRYSSDYIKSSVMMYMLF